MKKYGVDCFQANIFFMRYNSLGKQSLRDKKNIKIRFSKTIWNKFLTHLAGRGAK